MDNRKYETKPSGTYSNDSRGPLFDQRAIGIITPLLMSLSQIKDIQWEFRDNELEINGFFPSGQDNPTIIGHPRSAIAALEFALQAYDDGFQDGRDSKCFEEEGIEVDA